MHPLNVKCIVMISLWRLIPEKYNEGIAFRQSDTEKPGGHADTAKGLASKEKEDGQILCGFCLEPVTNRRNRISVNGGHRHTFTNPAGIVFEIGCFSDAPGCRTTGAPTREFTWFAGHSWNYSLCASCGTHLGWHFTSGNDGSFFGLILARLTFIN